MLVAKDIVKTFAGEAGNAPALRGVSLIVEAGEFVAVTGRSGSGKSTLLNILSSLLTPDAGQVLYEGRDLAALSARERDKLRATDFSMVFQMHHLLPYLTAFENVLTPFLSGWRPVDAARKAFALECLERVGLADKAERLPGKLSGGEQQRVAIARALVTRPRALFADEPTGSLDGGTGRQIMDILSDLNKDGLTVVLVTHEPLYARMAGRLVEIADGRLAADNGTSAPAPSRSV
ncbi:MAG: ABC-type antimicrobial peptide transport system, ATPase component [Solidesulfovibrio magneticus str. Maddingley MBC34]|uniref:Cell division ATP-binding protein FtsE n=1 Tax=Solidesulfovibrio magneticus str. Maddingley MBC34 TaxID=1206767 RepID=K6FRH0_9BACT|nr:MAG: ABC-type antimicrobial peptide transport system, ATPase component [Solidesulfovibrio magneticus str. Maddingley MBC34]